MIVGFAVPEKPVAMMIFKVHLSYSPEWQTADEKQTYGIYSSSPTYVWLIAGEPGYISTTQALGFVQDQKLAHYMHLPPRTVFFGQLVGGAVGSITQLLVQDWLFKHVDGICDASSLTW